jgi:hypothetical protein
MEKENIIISIKSVEKKKTKIKKSKKKLNNPENDDFQYYFDMLDEDDPYGMTTPYDLFMGI